MSTTFIFKGEQAIGAVDVIYSKVKNRYAGMLLRCATDKEKEFETRKEAVQYVHVQEKKYQLSLKKNIMATKKPTAKQLAARKRFKEMAQNGTLAKKRAASTSRKKTSSKKGLKFPGHCEACRTASGGIYVPGRDSNCDFSAGDRCISLPTKKTSSVSTSLGKPKRKKSVSANKICRSVIKVPGINSRTGKLLKGWKYKNGKPVKVKPAAKKPVAKKRTTVKRK